MREKPTAVDLLELARTVLRSELVHLLPDDKRYEVLMVANALGIAAREASAPEGLDEAAMRDLAAAIRAGSLDGDEAVYNRLMDEAEARVAVSNPKYLTRA